MQGVLFKNNGAEVINLKDETEILELLSTSKVICGNYYLNNYKYTVYASPNTGLKISLIDDYSGQVMHGDLVIIPQIQEVHDFDYEAINSSIILIHGLKVLIATPAEN